MKYSLNFDEKGNPDGYMAVSDNVKEITFTGFIAKKMTQGEIEKVYQAELDQAELEGGLEINK